MSSLFWGRKMNVNLAVRNLQNYRRLLKSSSIKNVSNFKNTLSTCKCSTLTNLTSKKLFSGDVTSSNQNDRLVQKRLFSNENSDLPSNKLPPLLPNIPSIVWPSLIKSIRNFILATFIIKPYFDREFNLPDFVSASKKAVEVVSKRLSEGDIKSLEGLVTSDILPTLQQSISLMSLSQREQLAINVEDIYFSFPYQVGIIFNDEENSKRFVEITMVYHSLRGLAGMRSRGEEPPLNMGMLPEYQQRISISNYRFKREFTKGVEDDWTVNLVHHFKPIDEAS